MKMIKLNLISVIEQTTDKHDSGDTLACGKLTAPNPITHPEPLSKCHLESYPCQNEWLPFVEYLMPCQGPPMSL